MKAKTSSQAPRDEAAPVYAARLTPLSVALAWPAFAALFVATGIGGYVLAYHIDNTAFSACYGLALMLALLSTFGANYGGENVRFTAQWVRFVTVPVLLAIAMITNAEVFFSREFASDSNTIMAGYVGLVQVLCIILIGLPVEGRPVPIAMPLVAALSLFGLLNLVIVDTIVQIGFFIFVAAALFLIGYERLLSHWQKRHALGQNHESLQAQVQYAARAFLAASAVWFAIFMASAALLYQPLFTAMPGILPTPLGRLNRGSQSQTDWRNSPRQVEVRGGNHTLSEREILKVNLISGRSPGLWRGRVYQNYVGSSWQDDVPNSSAHSNRSASNPFDTLKLRWRREAQVPLYENLPAASARFGQVQQVRAEIEPLSAANNSTPLYGAGRITALSADFSLIDINTRTSALSVQWLFGRAGSLNYKVTSEYVTPNNLAYRSPDLSANERKNWLASPATRATLELPPDPLLRRPLEGIVREIQASARAEGRKMETPVQKALAISAYLHEHCMYSLRAPLSPPTEDGVAYFLTTSRQGACDMFASSMTLLLRAMNVPARLATGFLEPEPAEGANTSTTIVLREKDAHAWVEYWVPQLGWITHDPSAGTRVADENWLSGVTEQISTVLRRIGGLTMLLPLVGVLLLGAGLFWPQIEKALGRTPLAGDADAQQRARVSRTYAQATRLLRRYLRSQRRHDYAALTPREFDDAISRAELPPAAKQEFAALTYLHAAAHYSSEAPDVTETQLKECLDRLKSALR